MQQHVEMPLASQSGPNKIWKTGIGTVLPHPEVFFYPLYFHLFSKLTVFFAANLARLYICLQESALDAKMPPKGHLPD